VLIDRPWATATVTDVSTGKPFRIADLVASGKVVFLETMAIWCSNCRAQQVEATVAFEELDPTRVEWVATDVESSETAEALARYREQNGFPFTYAIANAEFARALVAEFGEIVLSPPSVNIIVIGTDGRVTHLRGHKKADELRQLADEYGAA
jgi:thiol-disulfide isomerase/thioredoxin